MVKMLGNLLKWHTDSKDTCIKEGPREWKGRAEGGWADWSLVKMVVFFGVRVEGVNLWNVVVT